MSAASTLCRLLDEALALPPEQRLSWIDRLGAEHAALAPRLRALVARSLDPGARGRLQTLPSVERARPERGTLPGSALVPGAQIGGYRLAQRLGAGAMGVVWLAHASEGARGGPRTVALKFAHMAAGRDDLLVRLSREERVLAALDHPHIARLYGSGVTPEGQPYLVLEYVEGQPLDAHCADCDPPLRRRLALFLQIADAVAHAHERQIVHRDLKPANVLVAADGRARLLDFGIAQLLGDGLPQGFLLSMVTGRPLTLAYASPEQVLGDSVGVASDIYSLGVILYELLTGERPHAAVSGDRRALRDAVLFASAAQPSARVPDDTDELQLIRALDAPVLRALRKRPGERQPSARALAADVARALDER